MNMVTQNNDLGSVDLFGTVFDDVLVKFGGADTFVAGTILALDKSDNTMIPFRPAGFGAVFAIATVSSGAITGVTISSAGKKYKVGDVLPLFGGSGYGGVLTVATIGAGGAIATVTITTAGAGYANTDTGVKPNVIPAYASVPACVLRDDLTATGAGNVAIRAIVGGQVRADRLVIDTAETVDEEVRTNLRSAGIIAITCDELYSQDNQ